MDWVGSFSLINILVLLLRIVNNEFLQVQSFIIFNQTFLH